MWRRFLVVGVLSIGVSEAIISFIQREDDDDDRDEPSCSGTDQKKTNINNSKTKPKAPTVPVVGAGGNTGSEGKAEDATPAEPEGNTQVTVDAKGDVSEQDDDRREERGRDRREPREREERGRERREERGRDRREERGREERDEKADVAGTTPASKAAPKAVPSYDRHERAALRMLTDANRDTTEGKELQEATDERRNARNDGKHVGAKDTAVGKRFDAAKRRLKAKGASTGKDAGPKKTGGKGGRKAKAVGKAVGKAISKIRRRVKVSKKKPAPKK